MKSKPVTGKSGMAPAAAKASGPPRPAEDPRFVQAVQSYEAGLKLMQEHKFDRAKALLEKLVSGPSRELADRAQMHLNTCNQQLSRVGTTFKSAGEHYDYAVALINGGDYEEARNHLDKLLKQQPKADYALYGLAIVDALTNKTEDCLQHLAKAIEINPQNRFQARNDSDFQNMADDPRFTELLYPEIR